MNRSIEEFRAVFRREPNFPRAFVIIGAYEQKRLLAEANADIDNWERIDRTPFRPWGWAHRAYIYSRSGDRLRAQRALRELEALNRNWKMDPGPMILAHIGIGDKDGTFAWLQKAYSEHSPAVAALKVDPIYDPLRSDPRFQELMRRVGLDQ